MSMEADRLAELKRLFAQQTMTTPAVEKSAAMTIEQMRRLDENDLKLISLETKEKLLRNRVIINRKPDENWLHENCTGFYYFREYHPSYLIGFELPEDLALFKMKFEGAQQT